MKLRPGARQKLRVRSAGFFFAPAILAETESWGVIELPAAMIAVGQASFFEFKHAVGFEPAAESSLRSLMGLSPGEGLIGTEATGDIFETEDFGLIWRKGWAWLYHDLGIGHGGAID